MITFEYVMLVKRFYQFSLGLFLNIKMDTFLKKVSMTNFCSCVLNVLLAKIVSEKQKERSPISDHEV